MEDVMLNVKALAAMRNESIEKLAVSAGIDAAHLYAVSCGRAEMTADDIVKLSIATGIPEKNIQYANGKS